MDHVFCQNAMGLAETAYKSLDIYPETKHLITTLATTRHRTDW